MIIISIKQDPGSYLMVTKHHTIPKDFSFLYKRYPQLALWMWRHNPRLRFASYMWEKGTFAAFERYQPDIFGHPHENMPKALTENQVKRLMLYMKKYRIAYELNHMTKTSGTDRATKMLILQWGRTYGISFSIGTDYHGFNRNMDDEMNKGLAMFELAEDWGVNLIDPRAFITRKGKIN